VNAKSKKERHTEYMRRWRAIPKNSAAQAAIRREHKRKRRDLYKKNRDLYKLRHPEIERSRKAVHNAIRDRRLIRPNHCSKCGKECVPEGHHPDHSKPLEVVWLCSDDHRKLHLELRRREAGSATERESE
jgi:hypothetical protein